MLFFFFCEIFGYEITLYLLENIVYCLFTSSKGSTMQKRLETTALGCSLGLCSCILSYID